MNDGRPQPCCSSVGKLLLKAERVGRSWRVTGCRKQLESIQCSGLIDTIQAIHPSVVDEMMSELFAKGKDNPLRK